MNGEYTREMTHDEIIGMVVDPLLKQQLGARKRFSCIELYSHSYLICQF